MTLRIPQDDSLATYAIRVLGCCDASFSKKENLVP